MTFDSALQFIDGLPPWAGKVIWTVVTIAMMGAFSRIARRMVIERIADAHLRFRGRKAVEYTAYIVTFFVVGRIWFAGFQDVSTFLGLLSAGLAVALAQPITNLAGFLFIMWRRPIRVGDRIEMAGVRGDVVDIRLFQITMLEVGNWVDAEQSTGRVITMPNGKVFTEFQANYGTGFEFIWLELPVVVTFESDWRKAKAILEDVVFDEGERIKEDATNAMRRAETNFVMQYRNITPRVYTKVVDIGVALTVRFLCEPRKRRDSEERVWEKILDGFHSHVDIDLAYPTQRVFYNPREKKRDATIADVDAATS